MLRTLDELVHPDSIAGILLALACGVAVVGALTLVDGHLRLIQGAHVVVAVTLGWWIRGRYEARRSGAQQERVRVLEPIVQPVHTGSRVWAGVVRVKRGGKQGRHTAR
jgi:Flp pilus assembly protein TadB